jgi:hypothetical protein
MDQANFRPHNTFFHKRNTYNNRRGQGRHDKQHIDERYDKPHTDEKHDKPHTSERYADRIRAYTAESSPPPASDRLQSDRSPNNCTPKTTPIVIEWNHTRPGLTTPKPQAHATTRPLQLPKSNPDDLIPKCQDRIPKCQEQPLNLSNMQQRPGSQESSEPLAHNLKVHTQQTTQGQEQSEVLNLTTTVSSLAPKKAESQEAREAQESSDPLILKKCPLVPKETASQEPKEAQGPPMDTKAAQTSTAPFLWKKCLHWGLMPPDILH